MAVGALASTGLPPDPERFRDWKEYAVALSDFFASQPSVGQAVQPAAVLLVHADTSADPPPRALVDGILMFDPVLGAPVVSIGGEWKTFTLTM